MVKRYAACASALVLASLLGGCATEFAFGDLAGAGAQAAAVGGSPASSVKIVKEPITDADRKKIICDWAKAAGMADLKTAMLDSGKTKRMIAGLHSAHAVTCKADQAKVASAGPPAVPMPVGAASAPKSK